jgi:large subunit ribosomal protein L25
VETISLRAETRERGTKGSVHALRRQGMLPAVLYGKEAGNVLLKLPVKSVERIINTQSAGSALINLEVADGDQTESYMVMFRELQRDPVRWELIHADFYQVVLTEEIETEIPVDLVGDAPGVGDGGILQHMLRRISISCLPTEIPERLEVDISQLEIGGQVTVADIEPPAGVQILSEPESVIAVVVMPTFEEEEEEEEEGPGLEFGAEETGIEGEGTGAEQEEE